MLAATGRPQAACIWPEGIPFWLVLPMASSEQVEGETQSSGSSAGAPVLPVRVTPTPLVILAQPVSAWCTRVRCGSVDRRRHHIPASRGGGEEWCGPATGRGRAPSGQHRSIGRDAGGVDDLLARASGSSPEAAPSS